MQSRLTYILLALGVTVSVGDAPAVETGLRMTSAADQQAIWCWGSRRRSANVPFLRVVMHDGKAVIETKDYMHSNFVAGTKDIVVGGDRLEFTYWYKPLERWARCSLRTSPTGDMMAGNCDGELSAGQWGSVPSYLWRC